ncbi:Elmo domain-containing protein a [Thalictrum thalictroides]|uniref:Elmo domain-containing protein a n=1 Tax=Thalictrum thalictroides TaxID=46969 RepID=A0A7J6WZ28_THATH|nr:Elmo domain-containing protein a [Thalictrum thalictroides]
MTSRALRRRFPPGGGGDGLLNHNQNKKKHFLLQQDSTTYFEDLNEPLLHKTPTYDSEGYSHQNISDENNDDDDDYNQKQKVHLHWTFLFSTLIAQWAHWLANILLGSGSLLGRLISLPSINNEGPSLTPLQEQRLRDLQQRLEVPFDGNHVEHQDALTQLWRLAYPGRKPPPIKSELWKEMGWQGSDPSTDFRGGGLVSLENLIYFGKTYPVSFQRLLHKQDGNRSDWEYPFAVAGINISFMLVQMLGLHSGKPTTAAGIRFLEFLKEDEVAFDNLYCVAFQMMDAQWLAKHASYMDFNEVLKSTRMQLERELALEDVSNVKDLPMYNLLSK